MRILGIDPGSIVCGYGVIDVLPGTKLELVEYGVIEAKRQYSELPRRLELIFERVTQVIERTLPDEAAFEQIFYAKNVQSMLKLSHARGVAMVAATLKQIPIAEYSALQVKQCVTGKGRAGKDQVQFMVQSMLHIKETHKFYDATDALAIAITHATRQGTSPMRKSSSSKSKGWADFIENNPDRVVTPGGTSNPKSKQSKKDA